MPLVTRKTTAQWQEIWLAKLEKACDEKGLDRPATVEFLELVGRFLKPHSLHPANIPVETVPSFLRQNSRSKKQVKSCCDALTFFYTNVVLSEKHMQAIAGSPVKPRAKRTRKKR
jgi:hypothetical protein